MAVVTSLCCETTNRLRVILKTGKTVPWMESPMKCHWTAGRSSGQKHLLWQLLEIQEKGQIAGRARSLHTFILRKKSAGRKTQR